MNPNVTQAKANELLAQYGFGAAPNALGRLTRQSGFACEAMASFHADFSPLLPGAAGANNFFKLAMFLDEGDLPQADIVSRAQTLATVNHCLGLSLLSLKPHLGDMREFTQAKWTAFCTALGALTLDERRTAREFYTKRRWGLKDLVEITTEHVAAVPPLAPADALRTILVVISKLGNDAGLTTVSIRDLTALRHSHQPDSTFAGFTAWGPGDHGNAATNLKWHFLKHVCCISEEAETDPKEGALWWRELGMTLTRAEFESNEPAKRRFPTVAHYFGPNGALLPDKVEDFLENNVLVANPAILGIVLMKYMNTYGDYAIVRSRNMRSVIVQSNGTSVFISGAAGDAFIIGRLAAGTLGISSCYIVRANMDEKLRAAGSNRAWPLA